MNALNRKPQDPMAKKCYDTVTAMQNQSGQKYGRQQLIAACQTHGDRVSVTMAIEKLILSGLISVSEKVSKPPKNADAASKALYNVHSMLTSLSEPKPEPAAAEPEPEIEPVELTDDIRKLVLTPLVLEGAMHRAEELFRIAILKRPRLTARQVDAVIAEAQAAGEIVQHSGGFLAYKLLPPKRVAKQLPFERDMKRHGLPVGERPPRQGQTQQMWDLLEAMNEQSAERAHGLAKQYGWNLGTFNNVLGAYRWKHPIRSNTGRRTLHDA